MSSLISVKNLSRFYGETCAVNNISFELASGDILGFLGPNGAGKSTTMQMLSGNLAPSEGEIIINGVDLLDNPKQAKVEMGYLPETPPLYKEMKVDEYLHYVAKLRRLPKAEIHFTINNTKARCGLSDVGNRLIANLSKGYQQRVGIAQAILHSPQIIILDEPTVGLDPNQIREIRNLISELGENHGIILCSHILPEIQAVCNRVQIINQGELVFSAGIDELLKQSDTGAFAVSFSRSPNANAIQKLACIDTVEIINATDFIVQCSNTDELVEASVSNNWGLNKLMPQELTLEQIFMDLTSGDIINDTGTEIEPETTEDAA